MPKKTDSIILLHGTCIEFSKNVWTVSSTDGETRDFVGEVAHERAWEYAWMCERVEREYKMINRRLAA